MLSFTNYENIISFFNIKFNTLYLHQILFGYVLNIANINIYDYSNEFLNIFYVTDNNTIIIANHKEQNYNYNLIQTDIKLNTPLFIPLDILYPNDNNHFNRLNIIIENLIDRIEFLSIYYNFNLFKINIQNDMLIKI